jgi:hypothetical protein
VVAVVVLALVALVAQRSLVSVTAEGLVPAARLAAVAARARQATQAVSPTEQAVQVYPTALLDQRSPMPQVVMEITTTTLRQAEQPTQATVGKALMEEGKSLARAAPA